MASPYLQIKLETNNVGNESVSPTLSTKTLYAPIEEASVDFGPSHLDRNGEWRNNNFDPVVPFVESFSPTWEITTKAYPDSLGMFFAWAFGTASNYTVTQGDGSTVKDLENNTLPASTYRHRWLAPYSYGATTANPQTAQLQIGIPDEGVYYKVKGASVSKIDISAPDSGGVTLKISGIATYATRQSDPSLTPSLESFSIKPFLQQGLSLPAWLSNTSTTDGFELGWELPVEAVRGITSTSTKFPSTIEWTPTGLPILSGSIDKRHIDSDDIDALNSGTTFAARATCVSDTLITGSTYYRFGVQMPNCIYTPGGSPYGQIQNARRVGGSFEWQAVSDGASTSAYVEVINATTSYA